MVHWKHTFFNMYSSFNHELQKTKNTFCTSVYNFYSTLLNTSLGDMWKTENMVQCGCFINCHLHFSCKCVLLACTGTSRTWRRNTRQSDSGTSPPLLSPWFGTLGRSTVDDSRRAPDCHGCTSFPSSPTHPDCTRKHSYSDW